MRIYNASLTRVLEPIANRVAAIETAVNNQGNRIAAQNEKQHRLLTGRMTAEDLEGMTEEEKLAANVIAVRAIQNQNIALRANIKQKKHGGSSSSVPAGSGNPSAKPKANKQKAAKSPDLASLVLQAGSASVGGPMVVERGPAWDKVSKEVHQAIDGMGRLLALAQPLLDRLMTFLNKVMKHAIVLKSGQYKIDISTRPKLSFSIPEQDGALGLYWWRQAIEDYGRVEAMPKVLREVIDCYSAMDKESYNHAMLTLHIDGSCGIPEHQDKAFSKDSKGQVENGSAIRDFSFGCTRSFVISHQLKKDTFEEVAKFTMEHNSTLLLPGFVNAKLFHAVPLQEGCGPRVSLVLRRVDKKFVHPTENKMRTHNGEWTDLVKGGKAKTPVELRRQDIASQFPEEF